MARGKTKALQLGAPYVGVSMAQVDDDAGAGVAKTYSGASHVVVASTRNALYTSTNIPGPNNYYSGVWRGGPGVTTVASVPGFSTGSNAHHNQSLAGNLHGLVWGVQSVSGANATLSVLHTPMSGQSAHYPTTFTQNITTTPVSGLITPITTPSLTDRASAELAVLNVAAVPLCVVERGFATGVYTLTDLLSTFRFFESFPLVTANPGPVIGTYTGIPIPPASAGTGQTNLAIRRFPAPFSGRAHAVQFTFAASAAGNSARLVNATTGQVIASAGLTSTLPAIYEAPASSLTNRNFTRGDQLELQVTTGGTAGFTFLACNVICHTTSWLYDDPRYDNLDGDLNPVAGPAFLGGETAWRRGGARTHFSGPMTGGIIGLTGPAVSVPAGQTNYNSGRFIMPCDGFLLKVRSVHGGSAGIGDGTTAAVVNTTTGNTIIPHIAAVGSVLIGKEVVGAGTDPNTDPAHVMVRKGDVLQVNVTSGATGVTGAYGRLITAMYVVPLDHVNTHPRYD
jgi:hypothetical protein